MKKNRKHTRRNCAGVCNKKFKNLNNEGLCASCEVDEDLADNDMYVAEPPRKNNRHTRTQTRLNKEKEKDEEGEKGDIETEKQTDTESVGERVEGNREQGERGDIEDNGEKDELQQLLDICPRNTLISILKSVLNIVDDSGNRGRKGINEKHAIAIRGLQPESNYEYIEALRVILPSIQPADIINVERRGMETDGKTIRGVIIVEFRSEEMRVKCLKSKSLLENTKYSHLLITQALSPDQIIYKNNLIQILKFTGMERSHRINGELKLVLKATTGPAGNGGHGPLGPRRR